MQVFLAHQAKYAFMVHKVTSAAQFFCHSGTAVAGHLFADRSDLLRYRFVPIGPGSHWHPSRPVVARSGDTGQLAQRSEEHTSELQSHSFISYAVFCLKKKTDATRASRCPRTVQIRATALSMKHR